MELVNLLKQHLLSVLVWDVLDHNGCAIVFAIQDFLKVESELVIWLKCTLSHRHDLIDLLMLLEQTWVHLRGTILH